MGSDLVGESSEVCKIMLGEAFRVAAQMTEGGFVERGSVTSEICVANTEICTQEILKGI